MATHTSFHFLLGGHDLEMITIRELLQSHNQPFSDAGLRWGAKISAYQQEIAQAAAQKQTPVAIELENDLDLSEEIIWIDHHNDRAGAEQATALEQVFNLLHLPDPLWNRHLALVAANDRGYIPAMLQLGATTEEMVAIRQADREAQGVSPADELAAAKALNALQSFAEGRLTVARMSTNRTSALVDRLDPALGGNGYENLLVICPDELNFFGNGHLITQLQQRFGGWYGGNLPDYGFWGIAAADQAKPVHDFLLNSVS